ncbi:alpha-L-rhamnosidase N-terminal domain-containing protein [Streptomyces albogriseolus]|nr:alpha-L-rhamnosidase N-terminal domain-containing protein [Streptomyces viridodiastaticus]
MGGRVAGGAVGGPWGRVTPAVRAVTRLRREFSLRQARAERARLYVTALGLYEAHLNGVRVGRDHLAPGWTDYRTRVQYRTHDVTQLVRSGGGDALGVCLAPGWYDGNAVPGPHQYGRRPARPASGAAGGRLRRRHDAACHLGHRLVRLDGFGRRGRPAGREV